MLLVKTLENHPLVAYATCVNVGKNTDAVQKRSGNPKKRIFTPVSVVGPFQGPLATQGQLLEDR